MKAGGLDVGALTVAEAAAKLQQTYGPPLYNPVAVHVGGRRFRLGPRRSKLKFDTILTAKRAYQAGLTNPACRRPARDQHEQHPHPDLRTARRP